MCCRHFARNVTSSFFRASAQHIIKVSFHYYISYGYMLCSCNCNIVTVVKTGLLIFRGKKSKISRDFQGQIRGKIGRFRGIFAGKKSKFAEKSADFTGNFGGKLRQETISKKQPISLDFFWQILLKSINFASI